MRKCRGKFEVHSPETIIVREWDWSQQVEYMQEKKEDKKEEI